jgi:hypothetical protein
LWSAGWIGLIAAWPLEGRTAPDENTRVYDVPADNAERSLKLFSRQSGRGVIAASAAVHAVRTNAVKGEMTAASALSRMLKGTGLIATQDEKNGAFAVRSETPDPNAKRAALASAGGRPGR